ncbi:MAG: tRNA-uridine aminocarboxypropyltransferase [Gammaproteobacteria bacterium]
MPNPSGRRGPPRARRVPRSAPLPAADAPACAGCGKPVPICVCDRIHPHATRTRVLVLQHPREPREPLGTVPLVAAMLERCQVQVGLSWPSLSAATGIDGALPSRWAVLHAGPREEGADAVPGVALISRHGRHEALDSTPIDGIVVLDGTWSQAKSLWWRNPWLLKLHRIRLVPREPSMYGKLRREPRRELVSTLEAVADVLDALGEPPAVREDLRRVLRTLLQRARDAAARPAAKAAQP